MAFAEQPNSRSLRCPAILLLALISSSLPFAGTHRHSSEDMGFPPEKVPDRTMAIPGDDLGEPSPWSAPAQTAPQETTGGEILEMEGEDGWEEVGRWDGGNDDPHVVAMGEALRGPVVNLRREVLLIGDGATMRCVRTCRALSRAHACVRACVRCARGVRACVPA